MDIYWSFEYTARKPDTSYTAEDRKLTQNPTNTADLIDALVASDPSGLRPSCYSFSVLIDFLRKANVASLTQRPPGARDGDKLAFIDDRRDERSVGGAIRDLRSAGNRIVPTAGTHAWTAVVDAYGLHERLALRVSSFSPI